MKTPRLTIFFCFAVCLFHFSGCSPRYIPNRLNVPMLHEKKELRASINPRNLQLAYSPLQGLGIMANGYYLQTGKRAKSQHEESDRYRQQAWLLEAGAGYYTPISKDSLWAFGFFSGFGFGNVQLDIYRQNDGNQPLPGPAGTENRHFKAKQQRFFAQPSISYSSRHFEIAFSTRIAGLKFKDTRYANFTPGAFSSYGLTDIRSKTWLLAEPAITLRFGPPAVKFEAQAGYFAPLNHRPDPLQESYVKQWLILNFGLNITLAPRHIK